MTKRAGRKNVANQGVVSTSLVGARTGRGSGRAPHDRASAPALDPAHRSFLFRACLARARGGVLTVSFPTGLLSVRFGAAATGGGVRWTAPRKATGSIEVRCAPGAPQAFDRRAYPKAPAAAGGPTVTFHGAVRYCRLVLPDGPALLVQGSVVRIAGLPGSARPFDTAEILSSPASTAKRALPPIGGIDPSGPHQPFP